MKVILNGNELGDALQKVVRALPIKRSNPILECVKLSAYGDVVTIFATDLELAIEKKINAEVLMEGEVVVPGKLFADYAKRIGDEQIELDSSAAGKLAVRYLDSEVYINCFSADEYPVFKEVAKENSFIILKKDLKELISKVKFNVAMDEARPSLRGICLNIKETELEGVASDGYRLALSKMPIQNNGIIDKIVVPAKSMNELSALLDDENETLTVYIDKSYIMIDLFHTKMVSRLIAEDYINYEKIIPNVFSTEVTIDKKQFENSIERVSLINRSEKKAYVKMEIKEDSISLNAKSEEGEINEKVTIGLKGKDLIIGFNSKYISECMKAIQDPFVTLNFTSSTAPGIIKGEQDSWLYLILPLRVIG